jgi:uncharacterized protein YbjQ (UPF0145 family)
MATSDLIIATITEVEGRPVRDYLGIVSGEAAAGLSPMSRTNYGIRSSTTRASRTVQRIDLARSQAIRMMADRAAELGATAIIGVDIHCSNLHRPGGVDLFIVTVSGTAVTL